MGLVRTRYFAGKKIIGCHCCGTHLSTTDEIISKAFHGRMGKAYLMNSVVNIAVSPSAEDRTMSTGLHTVKDIFCSRCHAILGWKYVHAYEQSQKYKENKFILELVQVSLDIKE
jgi:hypothetical protein